MRVCAGIATAVLLVVATSVVAQEESGDWGYQENRNEMDDSVYRFVYKTSEDGRWFGYIPCNRPTIFWAGGKRVTGSSVEGTVWLRFDKSKAWEHPVGYSKKGEYLWIEHEDMVRLFLENVLLRMGIPATVVTDSSTTVVVRFDLLTFNQAWEKCPE